MKNLKNWVTNICGLLIALCSVVGVVATQGVVVPTWLNTTSIVVAAVSMALIAYFSGKNPNGSKKSAKQIEEQNNNAKE